MESYKTVQGQAQATLIEKKSEFIGHISFADTEEKALEFLNDIRARHRTANHNVYAYLLREEGRTRYSDDGEPAKTAGLPVLEVLRHAHVSNAVIVVTRYFGGTLLGTGGLVRAYTQSAQAALEAAKIVTISVCVRIQLTIDYALHDSALKFVEEAGGRLQPVEYGSAVTLKFDMLEGTQTELLTKLTELTRGSAKIEVSDPYHTAF
ncbi:MAG: IMPACT family protein [Oscillospiraceae bacterium]|nr:IMPACT family protein [Oscillospiraceae bacterium]